MRFESITKKSLNCLSVVLAALLVMSLFYYLLPVLYPIRVVQVIDPARHMRLQQLSPVLENQIATGFFGIDLQLLRRRLLQISWIQAVVLERVWPDILRITLQERQAIAYWGKDALLDPSATIFTLPNFDAKQNLPYFSVPSSVDPKQVYQYYLAWSQILQTKGFSIARLQQSTLGSWMLILDTGLLIKLGQQDMQKRLQRFTENYDNIFQRGACHAAYVDLRYTDGLVVRWAPPCSNIKS